MTKISSPPLLAAFCFLSCTDQRVYTPEGDDAAMAKIERSWNASVEDGDLSVTLCENRPEADRRETAEKGCGIAHVVRGGGRGTHDIQDVGGIGCGGCPFEVEAYVTAVVRTRNGTSSTLVGKSVFKSAHHGDTTDMPYDVSLTNGTGDKLLGRIEANGSFLITSLLQAGTAVGPVRMASLGPANCPL